MASHASSAQECRILYTYHLVQSAAQQPSAGFLLDVATYAWMIEIRIQA